LASYHVQAALVICGLFICDFTYMGSRNDLFSGTYPLIYSNPWSFYMGICYMRVYFWSPYLSHITRSTCTCFWIVLLLFKFLFRLLNIIGIKFVNYLFWCKVVNRLIELNMCKRINNFLGFINTLSHHNKIFNFGLRTSVINR